MKPLVKKTTGINGLDAMTDGGLPAVGLSVITGTAGAGKSLLALQTLLFRQTHHDERGILVTFEEPETQIIQNANTFRWDTTSLNDGRLKVMELRFPIDAVCSGEFDLTGLLAALDAYKAEYGAENIVFDGIDALLSALPDVVSEQRELRRIESWVRENSLFALITAKFGTHDARSQQRHDLLQFATNCVITLSTDFRETTTLRTLRVLKYRGSAFAANPVPMVIGPDGIEVIAFNGPRLSHTRLNGRISSGLPRLDTLLGGGYLKGSATLISGAPGTSKTSLGACFLESACRTGLRGLLVSFDEGAQQIVSNMRSIGIDLDPHLKSGQLVMESLLSGSQNAAEHLCLIRRMIETHEPDCLVVDPLSALNQDQDPFSALICESLFEITKSRGITTVCSSLLDRVIGEQELSVSHVSTIADTWIHVSYIAYEGERNRTITIIKSRGTEHSNQVREMRLTKNGIDLIDVYAGEGRVLLGTARAQYEALQNRQNTKAKNNLAQKKLLLEDDVRNLELAEQSSQEKLRLRRRELILLEEEDKLAAEADLDDRAQRYSLRRGDTVADTQNSPGYKND